MFQSLFRDPSSTSEPKPSSAEDILLGVPRQIASMSITEDREVHTNSSVSLRMFRAPSLPVNLKAGIHQYRERAGRDPHHNHPNRLDRILKMCLESSAKDELPTVQVVTWRGIMKKLGHLSRRILDISFFR